MGFLDLLSTKIENKLLKAKMEKNTLKALQGLSDEISQYQQQQAWADKGAMQLSPGSESPDVINPQIEPVKAPDPQRLLDALVPAIAMSNPAAAGTLLENITDPKRRLIGAAADMFSGGGKPPSLTAASPGQTGAPPPQGNPLEAIISGITSDDPAARNSAAAAATVFEMGGVPIAKGVERIQAQQTRDLAEKKYQDELKTGIEETYTDPTGATYFRYVNKVTKAPIAGPGTDPAGWKIKTQAKLEPVDVTIPGKGRVRIWVTPGQEGGVALGPEDQREVTEQLPGGGKRSYTVPKSSPVDVMTEQPPAKLPIPADDLFLWVHPKDLTSPTSGMTPEDATKAGMQRISTQAKQAIDSLKAANVVATEIKGLMEEVFPKKEGYLSINRLKRPFGAATQSDPKATRLFSLVNGTLAPIVRSLGEKGNLSDTDIKRAEGMMLSSTDSSEVARQKTDGLIELLGKIQRATLGAATTKAEPRKPGETPEQYMQRTGGG